MDEQAGNLSISVMPDPIPANQRDLMEWAREYHAERWEREAMQTKALSFAKRLHHLIQAINHALKYEPTHRHLREIPKPTDLSTMMDWGDKWYRIEVQGAVTDTWSQEMRGVMFL
jgi:hypothetical protein